MRETFVRILNYALKQGYTQDQIAEMCGLSVSTIWRIRKHRYKPSSGTIEKMQKVFPDWNK